MSTDKLDEKAMAELEEAFVEYTRQLYDSYESAIKCGAFSTEEYEKVVRYFTYASYRYQNTAKILEGLGHNLPGPMLDDVLAFYKAGLHAPTNLAAGQGARWIERLKLLRFVVPKQLRDTYIVPPLEDLKRDYLVAMSESKSLTDRRKAMALLVGQSIWLVVTLLYQFAKSGVVRAIAGALGYPAS